MPGPLPLPEPYEARRPDPTPTAPVYRLPRPPLPHELQSLPPGAVLETPLGRVEKDTSGRTVVTLSERGQAAMQAARRKAAARFGPHPFRMTEGSPELPVEPGKPNYNPFSGQWS